MINKKNCITNVDALIDHEIQLLSKIHSFINLLKIKNKNIMEPHCCLHDYL